MSKSCQGLRFQVARQEFSTMWALVEKLRFFIYWVLARPDMILFRKTQVTTALQTSFLIVPSGRALSVAFFISHIV